MISPEFIKKLKDRLDIVEVVADYVNLQKVGNNYRGLCPFHTETSPSFYVTPHLNIYHCFGCGASGDAINFVAQMEGISYYEAVEKLAQNLGMKVEYIQKDHFKDTYYQFYKFLTEEYKKNLNDKVIDYLNNRGLSKEEIDKFSLGYAPINLKVSEIVANKLKIDDIEKYGFPKNRDPFSGRLIIPIHDDFGRVIAFGGRLLGDGVPKYINSPETAIFKKSSTLYLYHIAKEYIEEMNYALICEGYFDAIAFHRAGLKNTVATLGTALTKNHVYKIKKKTQNVLLAFDSDSAGVKATLKSIEVLISLGMNVAVVELSGAKDAAELIQKFGKSAVVESIKNAKQAEEFILRKLAENYDLKNPNGINSFLSEISRLEKIFQVQPKRLENMNQLISKITGISRRNTYTPKMATNQSLQTKKTTPPTLEEYLIYIFFTQKEKAKDLGINIDSVIDLVEGKAKEILLIGKIMNFSLTSSSKDIVEGVISIVQKIDSFLPYLDENTVEGIKKELEERRIEKRIREIDALIKNIQSEEERKILLKTRLELVKMKEEIKRKK